uniref:Uncharacterized protein n=1 Tax=Glossina austeni TaxID=7395 RepID=A0A1A9UXT5_GLOAU
MLLKSVKFFFFRIRLPTEMLDPCWDKYDFDHTIIRPTQTMTGTVDEDLQRHYALTKSRMGINEDGAVIQVEPKDIRTAGKGYDDERSRSKNKCKFPGCTGFSRIEWIKCKEKREADAPSTLSYEIPMITLKKLKGLRPPPPPLKQPHRMHACTELLPTTPAHTHIFVVILLFIHFSSEHTNEMQQQQQLPLLNS